ncbi:hydroxymethylglutaryl-CoA reductase, degradative [Flavobacteriaceae bacterium]|nr:hydroxymethylglutaryl-CoA reductase, degradative [Flavobacteriaceae bacterium]
MSARIDGFSKLTKEEKINWITATHFKDAPQAAQQLRSYWNSSPKVQSQHDEFIENTLSNFYLPLGVAPNFLINDSLFTLPMVIEESSVVAAAGNAAKFWLDKGGFEAKVIDTLKVGQVHFHYEGDPSILKTFFEKNKIALLEATKSLTLNMEKRGGGIVSLDLIDKTDALEHYYQLHVRFRTADAMGANFINSCLECLADALQNLSQQDVSFTAQDSKIEIIMSILSNYVPECLVQAKVSCPLDAIPTQEGMGGAAFAKKIVQAIDIANCEPYRAVTHNKGIMNGVDALILATGNDFRAIEAGVHAYTSRSGKYSSLSHASIKEGQFTMELTLPLAIGTVGGLTKLHPMVNWCMELLGYPSSKKLMEIIAVAGLAQNFAALRSLVTSGIQKGHMKMHLFNILNQLEATDIQKEAALTHFKTHTVSVKAVGDFLTANQS